MTLDVLTATLKDIKNALNTGIITSEDLVMIYLDKLLTVARKLDAQRIVGDVQGELHGIPMLIVDTIATDPKLGLETTGGTLALLGSKPQGNAPIIQALLNAGAIILGKTNCTILNNYYGLDTPNGWSARLGTAAVNPYAPGTKTGGPCSGSTIALASGLCAAAIGQETNNGLVGTAGRSGLFGLRPSQGIVSTEGAILASKRQEVIGPLGKSAHDIALLLGILSTTETPKDYLKYLEPPHNNLSSYSLGVPKGELSIPSGNSEEAREKGQKFTSDIAILGNAIKVDPLDLPGIEALWNYYDFKGTNISGEDIMKCQEHVLILTEMYQALTEYLSKLENCGIKSVEDLVRWNEANPDKAFPIPANPGSQIWLKQAVMRAGVEDEIYHHALRCQMELAKSVEDALDELGIDAVVFPSRGWASCIAAAGGMPFGTVPTGQLRNGETIEVNFIARKGRDDMIIGLMAACEALFPARPVPGSVSY